MYKLCLFTFKQIVPRLIEKDDVISCEGALKWILLGMLEWFVPALSTRVGVELTLNIVGADTQQDSVFPVADAKEEFKFHSAW